MKLDPGKSFFKDLGRLLRISSKYRVIGTVFALSLSLSLSGVAHNVAPNALPLFAIISILTHITILASFAFFSLLFSFVIPLSLIFLRETPWTSVVFLLSSFLFHLSFFFSHFSFVFRKFAGFLFLGGESRLFYIFTRINAEGDFV